jgi:outer membrane protein assembly factor BamD
MRRNWARNLDLFLATLLVASLLSGCLGKKKTSAKKNTDSSAAPDKVLYDRAMDDIKHDRFTVGRLGLQTLINTYPDSEYLAKAKLAIADSYYKEGGTSGLTQAISEYKDFITFFPFLDEASYAQMQVAMAHYKMMEKPDRDNTQARMAEDEFQAFLLKYAQSPLVPQAEQRLREVQEVVAEGDFRVAHFYYIKRTPYSLRAAAARLTELTDRYPLYSQSDQALWMLGNIYEHNGQTEEQKAQSREVAEHYYARIVRDYPLSPLAGPAKQKLIADGQPVPESDPNAVARMQKEQQFPHQHHSIFRNPLGMLKTTPDVSMAAHTGPPNLNPPNESVSATEVLKPGSTPLGQIGGGGGTTGVSVEAVGAGSTSGGTTSTSTGTMPPPSAENNTTTSSSTGNAQPAEPENTTANATGNASTSNPSNGSNGAAASGTQANSAQTGASSAQPNDPNQKKDPNAKDKKESSSKKKKGLRKLIPW